MAKGPENSHEQPIVAAGVHNSEGLPEPLPLSSSPLIFGSFYGDYQHGEAGQESTYIEDAIHYFSAPMAQRSDRTPGNRGVVDDTTPLLPGPSAAPRQAPGWLPWARMDQPYSGTMCIATSALLFSLMAVQVKLLKGHMPVTEIVLFRSLGCALISCGVLAAKRVRPFWGRKKARKVITFAAPALTALAGWLWLSDPINVWNVLALLWSSIGVILVGKPKFLSGLLFLRIEGGRLMLTLPKALGDTHFVYTLVALLGSVFTAIAFVMARTVRKHHPQEPTMLLGHYVHVCCLLLSPVPLAAGWQTFTIPSWVDGLLLLGISVLSYFAQTLMNAGFKVETEGRASITNYSQVLFAYAWGFLIFRERPNLYGAIGAIVMAVSIILNVSPPRSKRAPRPQSASSTPARSEQGD
eukprot:jgi/Mesvir1/18040/Mv09358-RA.2